jgi:type IV secretory pathway VirD2 relaxase
MSDRITHLYYSKCVIANTGQAQSLAGRSGAGRISAHVDYLQNRPGHDREDGPRKFFNDERDGISGLEIKRELQEQGYSKVVAHKLTLSPGLDGVDVDAYTRRVMQEIQDEKGLDLKWWSVRHENTDHDHAHVVIAGLDKNGRDVNFSKDDYQKLREIGDQYLQADKGRSADFLFQSR